MTLSAVPSTMQFLALQSFNPPMNKEDINPLKTDLSSEISHCWQQKEAFQWAMAQLQQAVQLQDMWQPHQEALSTVNLILEQHRNVEFPQGMLKLLEKKPLTDLQQRARERQVAHRQLQKRLRHLTTELTDLQIQLQSLTRWLVLKNDLGQQGFSHRIKLLMPAYKAEQQRKQQEAQTLEWQLQPLMTRLRAKGVEEGWQKCHSLVQDLMREKGVLQQQLLQAALTPEEQMVLTHHPSRLEHFQAAFDARETLQRHDQLLKAIQQTFPHIQSLAQAVQEWNEVTAQRAEFAASLDQLTKPNFWQGSFAPFFSKTQHTQAVLLLAESMLPAVLPAKGAAELQQTLLDLLLLRHDLLTRQERESLQDLPASPLLPEPFETGSLLESAEDPVFLLPIEEQTDLCAQQVAPEQDFVDQVFLEPVPLFEPQPEPISKPSFRNVCQADLWEAADGNASLLFFEVQEVEALPLESPCCTPSKEPLDLPATPEEGFQENTSGMQAFQHDVHFFELSPMLPSGWLSQLQKARQVTENALLQATQRLSLLEDIVEPLQQVPVKNLVHVPAVLRAQMPEDLWQLRTQATQRQELWQNLFEKRQSLLQDLQNLEALVSDFETFELLKKQVAELQSNKGPLTAMQKTVLSRKQKALARLDQALQVHWKPGHKNHQQAFSHQQKKREDLLESAKTLQVALEACSPKDQDALLLQCSFSQLRKHQEASQTENFHSIQRALDLLIEHFPGTQPQRWQVLQNHLQDEVQGLTRRMDALTPKNRLKNHLENHFVFVALQDGCWKGGCLEGIAAWKQANPDLPALHTLEANVDLPEQLSEEADLQATQPAFETNEMQTLASRGLELNPAQPSDAFWEVMDPQDAEPEFQDLDFEPSPEWSPELGLEEVPDEDTLDLWDLDEEALAVEPVREDEADTGRLTTTRLAEQRAADLAVQYGALQGFDFLAEALDQQRIGQRRVTLQKLLARGHDPEHIEQAYRVRELIHNMHDFGFRSHICGETVCRPSMLSWENSLAFVQMFWGHPTVLDCEMTLMQVLELHQTHPWFRSEPSALLVLEHLISSCPAGMAIDLYVAGLLEAL